MGASAITLIVSMYTEGQDVNKKEGFSIKGWVTFEKGVQKVSILCPARGKAISDNKFMNEKITSNINLIEGSMKNA